MAQLNKEQIGFIDQYLENSEVIHIDIRSEMVDHVASGIEAKIKAGDTRDFYYIFKDYMVQHKVLLLDNNKQFVKVADKTISKALLKQIFSLQMLLVGVVLYVVFYAIHYSDFINLNNEWFLAMPFIGAILFAFCYLIALRCLNLDRYSGLERVGLFFVYMFQIIHSIGLITRVKLKNFEFTISIAMVSLGVTLLVALTVVVIKQTKYYKTTFKPIA